MRPAFVLAALLLLPSCAPSAESGPIDSAPMRADLERIIQTAAGDSAEISVAFMDLETGDSLLIDGHEVMHAASTMKVPVMLELFRRAEAGTLSLSDSLVVRNSFRSIADSSMYSLTAEEDSDSEMYEKIGEKMTIRDLIEHMITRSSNLATNILIAVADPDSVEATLARMGASEMNVLRGVEDIPAYELGMNNNTTAYGLMKTLQGVANGAIVSPAATEEMLQILERQEFQDMIPAGLPEGVRVGNKTGSITEIHHDGAIVYPPGREPYVLVVLTRGFVDRDVSAAAGRDISRAVYESVVGID